MKIAVVVTMLNEAATIGALMEALRSQVLAPAEVILVDGGSTDGTIEAARLAGAGLAGLRVLELQGSNISQGRNHGIRSAKSPLIAVTDAGCIPAPDWLQRMVTPLQDDPGLGLVSGSVIPRPSSHLEECIGRCSLAFRMNIGDSTLLPTARSMAFRRQVWEKLGGFPEGLDFGEDAAFLLSAVESGVRVRFDPLAVVTWRPRRNYREVVLQFYHYADGLATGGLSRRFHCRTVVRSMAGVFLSCLVLCSGHWLPFALLGSLAGHYLGVKARQGCFDIPSWKTYVRVPMVLSAIHVGTMAGVLHGNWRRLFRRVGP